MREQMHERTFIGDGHSTELLLERRSGNAGTRIACDQLLFHAVREHRRQHGNFVADGVGCALGLQLPLDQLLHVVGLDGTDAARAERGKRGLDVRLFATPRRRLLVEELEGLAI